MNISIQQKYLYKYFLLLVVLFTFFVLKGQNNIQISVSNTSVAATDSVLPFWLSANKNGIIDANNAFLNVSELFVGQDFKVKPDSKLIYSWGTKIIAAFGDKSSYNQINLAFAGISVKGWELKGGLFNNEIHYAGLSTSNGNIAESGNARPFPKVRFSTIGYKQLPFWQNWFSYMGEYEEGILNDKRYVDGTHLHHKSFNLKFQTSATFNFQFGFEHYAMWGGKSPDENIGNLPGWENYWRYVFALPGGENFPLTDQKNISGNQLGTYQLKTEKEYSEFYAFVYISHPWEDNSGLNWHNWPDNLIGLHINFKNRKKLVTDVVYEFTNTRQQGIRDSIYSWDDKTGKWKMTEFDHYYNHGIYRSGFTYHQKVMSSPLFFPVSLSNSVSMGIQSNRFFSHHIAAKGVLDEFIEWRGLLTYVQHYGTYVKPYTRVQKQISGLLEVQYLNPQFPVQIGLTAAGDVGNIIGKNLGIQLFITKKL